MAEFLYYYFVLIAIAIAGLMDITIPELRNGRFIDEKATWRRYTSRVLIPSLAVYGLAWICRLVFS